jgi:sodium transport system permease protein
MNLRNVITVYLKELRDMLRDRRTVVSMFVVPLLVMPVFMLSTSVVVSKVVKKAQDEIYSVMVLGGDDSPAVRAAFAADKKVKIVPTTDDWRQRVADKKVRAVVEIPAGFDAALVRGEAAAVKIYHYQGEMSSGMAVGEVRSFFNDYREKIVTARLVARSLPVALVKPFEIKAENVAPPEKVGGNAVGGFIPYLFIIFCFTGAIYPAADLTAGEKERGTMETILCSPVARLDLVLGKFLMVLTASLATVLCSLVSLGATAVLGGSLLASSMAAKSGGAAASILPALDPLGLLAVVALVLPLAVLFAALLLTISLFAKSFKEAQSYVTPLIIIVILPAAMALLPGVELNARLALVPILNVSLASKELVSGVWHWPYLALILGSTCLYAAAALALCVRMFNREDVLFRT